MLIIINIFVFGGNFFVFFGRFGRLLIFQLGSPALQTLEDRLLVSHVLLAFFFSTLSQDIIGTDPWFPHKQSFFLRVKSTGRRAKCKRRGSGCGGLIEMECAVNGIHR